MTSVPVSAVPSMPPTMRSDCSSAVAIPRCSRPAVCCANTVRFGSTKPRPTPPATISAISAQPGVACVDATTPAHASANSRKPTYSIAFGRRIRVITRPFMMLPIVMNTTSGVMTTPACCGDIPKPPWNSSGA
ncbi:hypothetical protein DP42_4546 [Burkholderia pseudomallei]|nr:hypothetical protein DP42_4546 [Burkholderia pseudomallei]